LLRSKIAHLRTFDYSIRWMAYVSDESGKNQVYVRPFPGPGAKAPISIEAGDSPHWSADGRGNRIAFLVEAALRVSYRRSTRIQVVWSTAWIRARMYP
jgi:Tol biopolymer transport system component